MANTIQMNFNVKPITRTRVTALAQLTHRLPGQMLDVIVAEAWERYTNGAGVSAETAPLPSQGERAEYVPAEEAA